MICKWSVGCPLWLVVLCHLLTSYLHARRRRLIERTLRTNEWDQRLATAARSSSLPAGSQLASRTPWVPVWADLMTALCTPFTFKVLYYIKCSSLPRLNADLIHLFGTQLHLDSSISSSYLKQSTRDSVGWYFFSLTFYFENVFKRKVFVFTDEATQC